MAQRPKLRGKRARRRFKQNRQIDVIGAEAHTVFAQGGARRLFQALHFLGDALSVENAERLDHLEGNAAGDAGHVGGRRQFGQWAEQFLDIRLQPAVEPRLDRIARRAGEVLVGDDAHARPQNLFPGIKLADRGAGPA